MSLNIFVPGVPAPQGSKRHVGKGVMIESSKRVKPWRESIRWSIREQWKGEQMQGAVTMLLEFIMPRPASTPRKTPAAIRRPDCDKLIRAIFDAVGSAGVYRDDSQITHIAAHKRIAEVGEACGVRINVSEGT